MTVNILCLHGCNQNAEMCKSLLSSFEKICKKDSYKFVYMQAPYAHPLGGFTWFKTPLDVAQIGTIMYNEYDCADTLAAIDAQVKEHNINVLLGFSQGGNAVDTYLHKYPDAASQIKLAIIMSSYSFIDITDIVNVRALNVVSDTDEIVKSYLYPRGYIQCDVITHDKAHKIPGNIIMRDVKQYIQTHFSS